MGCTVKALCSRFEEETGQAWDAGAMFQWIKANRIRVPELRAGVVFMPVSTGMNTPETTFLKDPACELLMERMRAMIAFTVGRQLGNTE